MELTSALFKIADTAAETTAQAADAAETVTQSVDPSVIFPHLGIQFDHLYTGFNVFGLYIAWYGVIIAIGIIMAAILVYNLARRTGQNADNYIDITIAACLIKTKLTGTAFRFPF